MTAFEEKPVNQVLITLSSLSYVLMLLTFAVAFVWVYYVSQAVDQGIIGDNDGLGSTGLGDTNGTSLSTVEVMYQATIISTLIYFMFRHHYC